MILYILLRTHLFNYARKSSGDKDRLDNGRLCEDNKESDLDALI